MIAPGAAAALPVGGVPAAAGGRLLLLCPDHFGLHQVFARAFERHSGCALTEVLYRDRPLRGPLLRLANSLSKRLLRLNLRTWLESRRGLSAVRAAGHFDHAVVICPERWRPADLKAILARARRSVVYYWDGFDHFPVYRETLGLFDRRCTFDPLDAERYGLHLVPNFHDGDDREPPVPEPEPEADVFFIGAGTDRLPRLLQIAERLKARGLRLAIRLLIDDPEVRRRHAGAPIDFIDRPIPPEEARTLIRHSRVLLDVHKEVQRGLSFRAFEAMGARRKLITTNPDIVNYDFYDPENIHVWRPEGEPPPERFFSDPYRDPPPETFRKYGQENWVRTVLGIGDADSVYRRPPPR